MKLSATPTRLLIALVRAYRFWLSPWLGSSCRFEPTCSQYALNALELHGSAAGTYLTLRRLVRCHPWCPGGHDPVPACDARHFGDRTAEVALRNTPLKSPSPDKISS